MTINANKHHSNKLYACEESKEVLWFTLILLLSTVFAGCRWIYIDRITSFSSNIIYWQFYSFLRVFFFQGDIEPELITFDGFEWVQHNVERSFNAQSPKFNEINIDIWFTVLRGPKRYSYHKKSWIPARPS